MTKPLYGGLAGRVLAIVMFGFCVVAFAACSSKNTDGDGLDKVSQKVIVDGYCSCYYELGTLRQHDDGTGTPNGGDLMCEANPADSSDCRWKTKCARNFYCGTDTPGFIPTCTESGGTKFYCCDNTLLSKDLCGSADGGTDATVDSSGSDTSGSDTAIVDSTTDAPTDTVADSSADVVTDSVADSVADSVVDTTDATVDSIADAGADSTVVDSTVADSTPVDTGTDVATDSTVADTGVADTTVSDSSSDSSADVVADTAADSVSDSSSDASSDSVSDTGPCTPSTVDASSSMYVLTWTPPSWYTQTGAVNLVGQTYDGSVVDWSLTPGTGLIALVPNGCGSFVGSISLPSGTTFEGNVKHADSKLSPGGVGWVFDTSSKDGGGCVKTTACCGLNFGTFTLTKGGTAVSFIRISNRTFGTGADATCPVTAPDLSRPALVDGGTTNGEVYFNIQFST